MPNRPLRPTAFCPTISHAGDEETVILRGENMWIRKSRFGQPYAEGYTGNQDLGETIATKTLTGTLEWSTTTKVVTGTGTAFLSELGLGCVVLGDGGANLTEVFVVTKITSDTLFTAERVPTADASGKIGYVLPVIFPVGTDRGTCIRGNVVQFTKGHYLGVGDGTFRVNGSALNATLALSSTPQFALFNPTTGLYTQDDVGIDPVTTLPTLTAVTIDATITNASNATPIVITVTGSHGLYNGQTGVVIAGVTTNTAANGTWTITKLTNSTFSLNGSVGNGAYGGGGTITGAQSLMRAGQYSVRLYNKSTTTLGYSQPSAIIGPVTLTATQSMQLVFNSAMPTDGNAYDIYVTPFEDYNTVTIEARYMGPWFKILGTDTAPDTSVTATDLIDGTHTTGRESGTTYIFNFADSEVQSAQNVATFDNFQPKDAAYVDISSGLPIYLSCLGKGNVGKTEGTSPGPAAIPAKPSNPEAVFLKKAITTAGGDYIVGAFNIKSRIFALCQNSLQALLLTTVDFEPIAFRSLWNAGFRNPYNACAVKEYIYADSTHGIVRSVAGGDDSAMEFEFADDMRDFFVGEPCGHKFVAYDPKNKAVCYFYSGAERRSGYWVTLVRPFMIGTQTWNPPIVLKKTNTDFIVSGVATIGDQLVFLAGGRTSGGSISVGTYVFDGGDSEDKDWYLAWNFTDSGVPHHGKIIDGYSVIGRFAGNTQLDIHGIIDDGEIDIDGLADNSASKQSDTIGNLSTLYRRRLRETDWGPYSVWTARLSGGYSTTPDLFHKLDVLFTVQTDRS